MTHPTRAPAGHSRHSRSMMIFAGIFVLALFVQQSLAPRTRAARAAEVGVRSEDRGTLVPSVANRDSSLLTSHSAAARLAPGEEFERLLGEANTAFEAVADYACVFVKQERVGGLLRDEQVANLKVRSRPFAVYFQFASPRDVAGQEACFAHGRNNGRMRARSNNCFLRALGFISLDVDDPRATRNNRHTIAEAGLGNLLRQLSDARADDRTDPAVSVRVADASFDERPCSRVECRTSRQECTGFVRSVVFFDKGNRLPVRFEGYEAGGDTEALAECYSYTGLRLNVGVPDAEFCR